MREARPKGTVQTLFLPTMACLMIQSSSTCKNIPNVIVLVHLVDTETIPMNAIPALIILSTFKS